MPEIFQNNILKVLEFRKVLEDFEKLNKFTSTFDEICSHCEQLWYYILSAVGK